MLTISPPESRTVFENVRWKTFIDLAELRRGSVPRMTYDQGILEMMSPMRQHEELTSFIGRLVETYSEVRRIEIKSVAATTFKRKDLRRAFEADRSYYIRHADQMRRKPEVDLKIDPPPDLVIEVEITSSAIQKLKLFAAMGVPEVWRHDGEKLFMYRRMDRDYIEIESSDELPGLSIAMIEDVLNKRYDEGETALICQFRRSIGG